MFKNQLKQLFIESLSHLRNPITNKKESVYSFKSHSTKGTPCKFSEKKKRLSLRICNIPKKISKETVELQQKLYCMNIITPFLFNFQQRERMIF